MPVRRLTVEAPGKVNLFLEVLEERADGYHEVRSLMAHISICDILTFERTGGRLDLKVRTSGIPVSEQTRLSKSSDNLVMKAALALRKATGYRGGAKMRLEKHIPIAAGLGGGSADAAAALRGLNQLWQTGLSIADLCDIGGKLGSDVPAMVCGGVVTLEGMGERVRPVEMRCGRKPCKWHVVVVNPGFGVSTKDICTRYTTVLTSKRGQYKRIVSAVANWDTEAAARDLFNSLECTVFHKYPLLSMIADGLRAAGAQGVLLCGSGASVFALAKSGLHARVIARDIGRTMGPWLWTRVAEVLPDGVTVAHGPLEARV